MRFDHRSPVIPLAFLAVVLLGLEPTAAPTYGPWTEPVNLGTAINSSYQEMGATLSKDGLSLYFSSARPCGEGDTVLDLDIWVAQRTAEDAPWGPAECLEINVNGSEDSAPAFSRDGHWMFFVSNRPGGLGTPNTSNGRDIWVSWRAKVHDDHAWTEPFNAGAINSTVADAGPTYFENDEAGWPQVFFTSNRNGTFDIWVAEFGNGQFAAPTIVPVVNSSQVEARPSITHDGLELFFFRQWDLGGGNWTCDIFVSTREDPTAPWSEPVNLGAPVNTGSWEWQPAISADRQMLFFTSNRPGGSGSHDIWVSTRSLH